MLLEIGESRVRGTYGLPVIGSDRAGPPKYVVLTLAAHQNEVIGLAGDILVQMAFARIKRGEKSAQLCDGIQIRESVELLTGLLFGGLALLPEYLFLSLRDSLCERRDQIQSVVSGLSVGVFVCAFQ